MIFLQQLVCVAKNKPENVKIFSTLYPHPNDNLQGLPRNEVKVKQAKKRIIEKEVATVTRWFEVKLAIGQITSVSTVREDIKRYILEAVQTFYGI